MSKKIKNHAPEASALLVALAQSKGFDASVIDKSRSSHRKYSSLSSTHSPQKVVFINNYSMSIEQARQYLKVEKR